jgi:hypothetical protein
MCTVVCDGSCRAGSGVGEVGEAIAGVVKAAWWLGRRVVVPLAAGAIGLTVLYLAGTAFTPRSRERREASGATWLRPGVKVAATRLRVHWYAWPGWQRTAVRLGLVLVAAAAWVAPVVTAAAAATAAAGTTTAAIVRRRSMAGPRRVRAVVGNTDRPALAAGAATKASAWATFLGRRIGVMR